MKTKKLNIWNSIPVEIGNLKTMNVKSMNAFVIVLCVGSEWWVGGMCVVCVNGFA